MTDHIESYTERLAAQLETDPPKRKGERTRERIKLAAAEVLEREGFHAMRVSDITRQAASSDGSFYVYFKDKKEVALTVLQEFLTGMQLIGVREGDDASDPYNLIQHANHNWITAVRANAGLMRSVFQLSDEDQEFGALVNSTNRRWYQRVANSVVRNYPQGAADPSAALFAAWALGGMMDELMRRLVVYPDADFVEFLEKAAADDEALASALSVIWMRVLYPRLPLPRVQPKLAAALSALGVDGELVDRATPKARRASR